MTNKEKKIHNDAIDKCVKLILSEGFSHTAGLNQFIANQFAILANQAAGLKK